MEKNGYEKISQGPVTDIRNRGNQISMTKALVTVADVP